MKTIRIKKLIPWSTCVMCFGGLVFSVNAQTLDSTTVALSLEEVVWYAKESNKLIETQKIEESAAELDLVDARMGALPRVHSNASYLRYSDVTVYDGLLGESHHITKPPDANAGALSVEASFNLYSGGRHHSVVRDFEHKKELASINTREQEASIGLQAALQYLDLVLLHFQQQLIRDQVTRAKERAKNIRAFYENGKVTRSDVLRADLLLSNVLLSETSNRNDYLVSNQKLNTLLNLQAFTRIIPADTASLSLADTLEFERLSRDYSGAFSILKLQKRIELQQNRLTLTRAVYHPSVTLFAGYGFNYPNGFIFPPASQTLSVGHVGVKLSYDISSLYHNRHKVKSVQLRGTVLQRQKEWVTDNVQLDARALAIKYDDALNRMLVIQKSIEQAKMNYQIQNTKYFNQLGLLTDLLEADNLYQESRFNYIRANIAALSIYYRLLFVIGKL